MDEESIQQPQPAQQTQNIQYAQRKSLEERWWYWLIVFIIIIMSVGFLILAIF